MKLNIQCAFSGYRIYPGHGKKYVRADSKAFNLLNSKAESLFLRKRNPRKVAWTTLYRKLHRKGVTEEVTKKRARKVQKVQRAIVGTTLEILKAKRNQKPEVRQAAREAALKEIKDRKKLPKKAPAAGAAGATPAATGTAKAKTNRPKQPKVPVSSKPAGKGR